MKANIIKTNMGTADRIIRLVIAGLFGIMFYTGIISGVLGVILVSLAGIFVITSLISFCPIYALFGTNTCPTKPSSLS